MPLFMIFEKQIIHHQIISGAINHLAEFSVNNLVLFEVPFIPMLFNAASLTVKRSTASREDLVENISPGRHVIIILHFLLSLAPF